MVAGTKHVPDTVPPKRSGIFPIEQSMRLY